MFCFSANPLLFLKDPDPGKDWGQEEKGATEDEMVGWHQWLNGHETMDWFQIGKEARQGCILSPCLFNLHAEYIMWNAGLDEAQAGIRIARRNINNLRYADDTILMAELKSLFMKVKEESEKAGLKLQSKEN